MKMSLLKLFDKHEDFSTEDSLRRKLKEKELKKKVFADIFYLKKRN